MNKYERMFMTTTENMIDQYRNALDSLSAEEILTWSRETFGNDTVFASSMGLEDQVLADMISRLGLDIEIFTLDTGRLFNDTYHLIEATEKRYGNNVKIYFPDSSAVEEMVNEKGVNLFYNGVEERERCCSIRKREPLRRALAPYSSWICGLRQEQSPTRENLRVIAWDDGNRMSKINPLFNWTEKDVRDYIRKYDVPYNKLHDEGYPSIGCACCTRAVKPEEDIRSGRWWWESPEQKECGLHVVDGKLVRENIS